MNNADLIKLNDEYELFMKQLNVPIKIINGEQTVDKVVEDCLNYIKL